VLLGALMLAAPASVIAQHAEVDAGLRMYRDGILRSGEPMTAIVAGDVSIVGTQFSCESCHGRSGMGTAEGAYIVPPIAAQFLFVESPQPKRPAYDNASLATVLRSGVTPSGRTLSTELMPRYPLADADVSALSAYLATLSARNSPGVDDTVIRFATVVTEDVDPAQRDAVFAVLNRFAEERNRATRNDAERWDRGYTKESRLPTVFRDWVIDAWTLTGPSDTWDAQLERYYEQAPVFAMVSGLGQGSWEPVARFCEHNGIPCLFPGTDQPYAEDGDFYTYYFSRGLGLEAALIASHAAAQGVSKVLQVYCDRRLEPVASGLRAALQKSAISGDELVFDCADSVPVGRMTSLLADDDAAVVLWVTREQFAGLPQALPAGRLYVSSTLLDGTLDGPLARAPGPVFVAHPFLLPGKIDPALRRFELWAKTRDIDVTDPRHQAEAFFACLVLNDAVKHVGRFFVREFALDMLDHAQNLAAYVPVYPRPTLGPGQRFLTKGGYVLPIVDGKLDTSDAAWILP